MADKWKQYQTDEPASSATPVKDKWSQYQEADQVEDQSKKRKPAVDPNAGKFGHAGYKSSWPIFRSAEEMASDVINQGAEGLSKLFGGATIPAWTPSKGWTQNPVPDATADERFGGASDVSRAVFHAAGPALIARHAITAPIRTAIGVGTGMLGQEGFELGARGLGAGPGLQRFAGDVGGLVTGLAASQLPEGSASGAVRGAWKGATKPSTLKLKGVPIEIGDVPASVARGITWGGLGKMVAGTPGAVAGGVAGALSPIIQGGWRGYRGLPLVDPPVLPSTPFKTSTATAKRMPYTPAPEQSGMPRGGTAPTPREPAFGPDVPLRPTAATPETPVPTIPGGKFEVKSSLKSQLKTRAGGAGGESGMPGSTGGRNMKRAFPLKPRMTSPEEEGIGDSIMPEGTTTVTTADGKTVALTPAMRKAMAKGVMAERTGADTTESGPSIKVPLKGSSTHAERLARFVAEQAEKGDLKDTKIKATVLGDKPGMTKAQWRALPDAEREAYIVKTGYKKPAKAGSKGLARDLATITEDIARLLPD